ncbi:phosphate ABC transporter substrate-binding protein PstS [Microbacterium dauci]|uniref:Phosphate-binding protein n=1 Tax=Microbacterium dauci TaxID=3048008 RepID=A0ABT6ZFM5_9MICO|nr:phosphate ABC transporter substrate-binding protein PstS [Microbacterium sp. LX3-4]MDJ1114959.1 phosphate ABC transporter substrate-binding protein PstS [Microbacterium sp. LX3-4]
MKLNRIARLGAVAAVAALSLTACAANEPGNTGGGEPSEGVSTLSGTVNATGASSQGAAQQAWTAAFQDAHGGVTINYQPTGSGTGRDNFLAGSSQFIGSDRAFNAEELAAGGFNTCATDEIVEVPAYISPVAVVFNLEGVEELNLTPDLIGDIFNEKIEKWNDPAIAEINEGVELPDLAITPVFRGDASGTTGTFTAYLASVAPEAWPYEDADEWPVSTTRSEAAQQTSGVEAAVNAGEGTIGYIDASRVGELGSAAVQVGEEFVPFSAEAAAALVSGSPLEEGRGDGDLVFDIDPAAAPAGAYPIALVSYLIGCVQYEDAAVADVVRSYFEYVVSAEGQDAANAEAGSAPLSDEIRTQAEAAIALIGAAE